MLLLSSPDFLKKKIGTLTLCQTVWIQIMADILSKLIWAQTVCKGYHAVDNKSKEKKTWVLLIKLWKFRVGEDVTCDRQCDVIFVSARA